jgi:hypothetical protein
MYLALEQGCQLLEQPQVEAMILRRGKCLGVIHPALPYMQQTIWKLEPATAGHSRSTLCLEGR